MSMAMQAGAVDVSSKAKEVTVFTSGAQVTRTATAQVAAGQSEVRIMGLHRLQERASEGKRLRTYDNVSQPAEELCGEIADRQGS